MPEWGWWVLGAVLLLGIEALTLDLIFASLALGAVVGAIVAALGFGVLVQVLAAVITALLTLFLLRPIGVEPGMRFAIREGGKTIGAGVVTEVR